MIKGKTVGLRAIERTDLPQLKDWRNIPEFRINFREYRELNMHNQEKWFDSLVTGSQTNYMFAIEKLNGHTLLGACGLIYVNTLIRSADLSLYIGYKNKYIDDNGYALEATKLLLDYGFKNLNLHKVWTELYEFDKKKIDFLTKKFGFKKDAVLRDNCFEGGKYWNSYIFSLLEDEYKG